MSALLWVVENADRILLGLLVWTVLAAVTARLIGPVPVVRDVREQPRQRP